MANRLVYGVGYTDCCPSDSPERCAAYKVWSHMLERCYAHGIHEKHPTYVGVTVAPEWHVFSAFAEWYAINYRPGCVLDKDLKFLGNKVYSPDTCVFIPQDINNLLIDSASSRGDLPIGVTRDRKRYKSRFTCLGKSTYIGTFPSPELAHQAYLKAKSDHIFGLLKRMTVPAPVKNSLWLVAHSMKGEEAVWA